MVCARERGRRESESGDGRRHPWIRDSGKGSGGWKPLPVWKGVGGEARGGGRRLHLCVLSPLPSPRLSQSALSALSAPSPAPLSALPSTRLSHHLPFCTPPSPPFSPHTQQRSKPRVHFAPALETHYDPEARGHPAPETRGHAKGVLLRRARAGRSHEEEEEGGDEHLARIAGEAEREKVEYAELDLGVREGDSGISLSMEGDPYGGDEGRGVGAEEDEADERTPYRTLTHDGFLAPLVPQQRRGQLSSSNSSSSSLGPPLPPRSYQMHDVHFTAGGAWEDDSVGQAHSPSGHVDSISAPSDSTARRVRKTQTRHAARDSEDGESPEGTCGGEEEGIRTSSPPLSVSL